MQDKRPPIIILNEHSLKTIFDQNQLTLLTDCLSVIQGYQENRSQVISLLLKSDLTFDQLINFLIEGRTINELIAFLQQNQKKVLIQNPPQIIRQNIEVKQIMAPKQEELKFELESIDILLPLVEGIEQQMQVIKAEIFKNKVPEAELLQFLIENEQCSLHQLNQFIAKYEKQQISQIIIKEFKDQINIDDKPFIFEPAKNSIIFENEFMDVLLDLVQDKDDEKMQQIKSKIAKGKVPEALLLHYLHSNQQCSLEDLNQFIQQHINEQTTQLSQTQEFDFANELFKLGKSYEDQDLNQIIFIQLSDLDGFEEQQNQILELLSKQRVPQDTLSQFLGGKNITIQMVIQFISQFQVNQNGQRDKKQPNFDILQALISIGWYQDYALIIQTELLKISQDSQEHQEIVDEIQRSGVQCTDLIQFLIQSDHINFKRLFAFLQNCSSLKTDQSSQNSESLNVFDQLLKLKWHQNAIEMFKDVVLSKQLTQQQIQAIIDSLMNNQLDTELVIDYFTTQYTNYENCIKFISGKKLMVTQLSQTRLNTTIKIPNEFQQDKKISQLFSEEFSQIYPNQFINQFSKILLQQNFKTFEQINQVIIAILDYREFLDLNQILEICQDKPEKIVNQIRRAALDSCFKTQSDSKSIYELMDEILNLNEGIDLKEIIPLIEGVQEKIKIQKGIKQQDVQSWAKSQKIDSNYRVTVGDMAMICQGVHIFVGFYPRETQLLSVLLLFQSKDQGRLAQIYTGEGKSLIVSMFAVLKRLFNSNHVDIVTSSEVLAIRDSEHMKKFYEIFGLRSSHNIRNKIQGKGPRECYKADIVYGDAHSFMADILCHEYQLLDTRGTRKFDCIIIDEVDSMLIDGSNSKTILSSSIPGMKELTNILELIWAEIQKQKGRINNQQQLVVIAEHDDYLIDFKDHIKNTLELLLAKEELRNFISQYRLDYIHFMLEKWIQSAIAAQFYYHENKNYIIEENEKHVKVIKIVDYDNTGVIQQNMQWRDGVHQFLQIKHKLSVSSLSLTTNYLSNIGFFRRYKQNIFGLTGTLGSESTQQLLRTEYNVNLIFMPAYKRRQLTELQGYVGKTEDDWINNICLRILGEINIDRAVLLINQAISDVTKIDQRLKTLGFKNAKLYMKNGEETNNIQNKLMPRDVIIATNLAGRGTDIDTSEQLENNGGLHVIVTFMPKNLRVQEQAFGRTGRQGKRGTAQLVLNLNKSFLGNLGLEDVQSIMESLPKKELKFKMDVVREGNQVLIQEQNQINLVIKEKQMDFQPEGNKVQNMIFQKPNFGALPKLQTEYTVEQPVSLVDNCKFARDTNEEENNNEQKVQMNVLIKEDQQFEQFCETIKGIPNIRDQPAIFNAVEEQWGLYLEQHQEDPEKLQDFFSDIKQQAKNGQLIKNPKYYVQQALEANFMQIEPLQKAIQLNQKDFAPYYYAGCTELKSGKIERFQSGLEMLQKAKVLLKEKTDNLKGFHIANEINKSTTEMTSSQTQESVQEQKESLGKISDVQFKQQERIGSQISKISSKNSKLDDFQTSNLQLQKQLKIYDQLIGNIDSVQEIFSQKFDPNKEKIVVEFKDTRSVITDPELQSELDEVITDSAITKIGKVKKVKKNRRWWDCVLMIALGGLQFVLGAAICAFSGGAATSIGVSLMAEGVKDIFQGVKAAWSGVDIDWGAWGQGKVISLGMTLALAGPTALSELGQGLKMMQKVPLLDILKSIPQTTMEGVLKGSSWVGAQFKGVLENVASAFKGLKITDLVGNFQEVQQNLMEQVNGFIKTGQVPENIGGQMKEIVKQALNNAKGLGGKFLSNDLFIQNIKTLGGPFLSYLAQKSAAKRTEQENKDCIKQVTTESSAQLQKQKTQLKVFIDQQKQIKVQLIKINEEIPTFLQNDQDIKEVLGFAQIFFDQNYETEQEQIAIISIHYFPEQFKEQIKKQEVKFKKEVEQLNLDNEQQLNQFYKNTLKQITLDSIHDLKQKLEDSDFVPLVQPILQKYRELRQSLEKELEQQLTEIQQLALNLKSEKASLIQLFQTFSNTHKTQAQVDDFNQRQEQFSKKVDYYNEKSDQLETRITQFKTSGQIDSNGQIKSIIKRVVNKLIEQNQLDKYGVTPKQNVTLIQIQSKFQSLLKNELPQDQQCVIDPLMEGFKFAQNQLQTKKKGDFLASRLFDAVDDQIVNFIVQKIFTDKLQGEANKIMQNIAIGN